MSIFFTKSETGYLHVANNKVCQDFSACYDDVERTVVTACDGHGSDVYIRSHIGSSFASKAAIDVLREVEKTSLYKGKREGLVESIRLNVLCRWNELVEAHLCKHPIRYSDVASLAEQDVNALKRNPVKAYGTTLNAAMILGTKIICVSIGDGGCFLVKGGVVMPAFPEDEDEPVANVTYSLCQDDAFSHIQVAVHELSSYDGAVVCTDGILNPYQNLKNFSSGLIAPAILNLSLGRREKLSSFVSEVGTKLGTGDDVSLGILVKDNISLRVYRKAKWI